MSRPRLQPLSGRVQPHVWIIAALILVLGGAWWLAPRDPPPGSIPATFEERPIPEAHWGQFAPEAREHVRQVRQQLDEVKAASNPTSSQLASAYGELGEVYLAYAVPAPAVPCFQNASQLDARDFRWSYLQAVAQLALMETQQATDSMREAVRRLKLDPAAGPEHHVAALCFLGDGCMRLNRFDEARRCFDEALELAPDCIFALFKRGQLAVQAGDSQGAISDFERAVSLFPDAAPAAISLALAAEYQKTGQHAAAAQHRTAAASASNDAPVSYPQPLLAQVQSRSQRPSDVIQRVRAELARDDLQAAFAQLDTCLSISPRSPDVRRVRGELLLQLGRVPEAVFDLELAHQESPGDAEGRSLLIEAYARRPETLQKARAAAETWREEQPDALKPLLLLANLDFDQARYDEALAGYAAAVERAPDEVEPRVGMIFALCALGRYIQARDRFDEVLQQTPHSADLKLHLARFLATCPDETVRDPERSLTMIDELTSQGSELLLRETRVYALASCGRIDAALQELAELAQRVAAAPQSPRARRVRDLRESIERNRTLTERWPFAETIGH